MDMRNIQMASYLMHISQCANTALRDFYSISSLLQFMIRSLISKHIQPWKVVIDNYVTLSNGQINIKSIKWSDFSNMVHEDNKKK